MHKLYTFKFCCVFVHLTLGAFNDAADKGFTFLNRLQHITAIGLLGGGCGNEIIRALALQSVNFGSLELWNRIKL